MQKIHVQFAALLTCCFSTLGWSQDWSGFERLSTEQIEHVFSGVRDEAAVQDSPGNHSVNLWYTDGYFTSEWNGPDGTGRLAGKWLAENDQRCITIIEAPQELEGIARCGPIYRKNNQYYSVNSDGSVHGIHKLTPLIDANEADSLTAAWASLTETMKATEAEIRRSPFYESEQERARAYLMMSRALLKALEEQILKDTEFPYFRIMDPRIREGGDNPDQRYLFAEIEGGVDYLVFGTLGSASRIEVQLYAGRPWAKDGRSVGYVPFEEISIKPDGSFSVPLRAALADTASGELHNASDSTTVMVRQIYSRWEDALPGEVHIDRIGYEGKLKPAPTIPEVSEKIHAVAYTARQSAVTWPAMVAERYVNRRAANSLGPLIHTFDMGGAKGRWMASAHFNIPAGKALVIKSWPSNAKYQGIQLTDRWFSSLEYANRQTSLTGTQSHIANDSAIYHVITEQDPGYPNWLDTVGLQKGTILLRYDGVRGTIDKTLWPTATLVDFAQLAATIPDFHELQLTGSEREAQLAKRRAHIQRRFGF